MTHWTMRAARVFVVSAAAIACSAGTGPVGIGAGPTTTSGDPSRCRAACGSVCAKKLDGMCQTDGSCTPAVDSLRPEFVDAFLACVQAIQDPACKASDKCVESSISGLPSRPADKAFADKCLARRKECTGAFSDDYCGLIVLYTPATVSTFDACLAKPCAEIRACFKAAGID